MKNKLLFICAFLCISSGGIAQQLPSDGSYIDAGDDLKTVLDTWEPGKKISDDDNFYISRIKPKTRFRNIATQVNQGLTEANDKKLLFWVPINTPETNAFPNGIVDSEVFPMWNYITHYGNWSAGFIRMPGNFMDVAHKNGVGVSVTAGIPHPTISSHWQSNLNKMIEVGPQKMADLLLYYGIDGLGYNSEFYTNATFAASLRDYHGSLYSIMTNSGKAPLYEMIWYDGTNDNGGITFD